MRKSSLENKNGFQEAINNLHPEDFDGHTVFSKLTPVQRLDWLQTAIQTYLEFKNLSKKEIKDASSATNKI